MTARADWTEIRPGLVVRSGGRCEACGRALTTEQLHVHHRRPRGMGGTRRSDVHSYANLLALHPACHAAIESRREQALDDGLLVLQSQDPATVPVLIGGRGWVLLTADGAYEPLP